MGKGQSEILLTIYKARKKAVLKTDREQTRARKTDRQKSPLSRAMGLDHREGGTESASLNS